MSAEPHTSNARRPVRIGRYEVVKHIATGGMGAVYLARDTDLDRDVALKVLAPDLAASPLALERFRREARNAAKLRHENIVAIYEFGEVQGTWFLALEYVQGIDLFEYIKRKGRLEPEEARRITIQAALALQHAFRQGIVHRDIKPSNFLVTRKNDKLTVKMTDLGLSREARPEESRVTKDGTTVGTVDYMAPEQARDSSRADTRSDIYSLGCSLYHMLAGQPPFSRGGIAERLYAHVQDEPPDIRSFSPRVSEPLLAVMGRMLAKQPADRYQTPAELVKDLLAVDAVATPVSDRNVLAGLAFGEDADDSAEMAAASRRNATGEPAIQKPHAPPKPEQLAAEQVEGKVEPWRHDIPKWVVMAAVGALVLLAILAGLLVLRKSGLFSRHERPAGASVAGSYNNSGNHRVTPGSSHALRTAGIAPRRPGNGRRPGSIRPA